MIIGNTFRHEEVNSMKWFHQHELQQPPHKIPLKDTIRPRSCRSLAPEGQWTVLWRKWSPHSELKADVLKYKLKSSVKMEKLSHQRGDSGTFPVFHHNTVSTSWPRYLKLHSHRTQFLQQERPVLTLSQIWTLAEKMRRVTQSQLWPVTNSKTQSASEVQT